MKNYKYYIFDFDLTLMDTVEGITGSARQVILNHPEITCVRDTSSEYLKQIIGMTLENGLRFLVPHADDEMIAGFVKEYRAAADEQMLSGTHPYKDTEKVLRSLKEGGAAIGIFSLKVRSRVVEALEKYGFMKYVDYVIGSETVINPKPNPEGLNMVMEQLGVTDLNEVIYVGDSIYDAGTAANAGVDFVGVTTGNADAAELGQYPNVGIINCLGELL